MLTIVILICTAGVARSDCKPHNAVAVVRQGDVGDPTACGLMGQAQIAATLRLQDGEYLKILCSRHLPPAAPPADEAKLAIH